MLVLTRKRGERILIGEEIVVTVLDVSGDQVRIGIDAPRSVQVFREELHAEVAAANQAARVQGGAKLPKRPPKS